MIYLKQVGDVMNVSNNLHPFIVRNSVHHSWIQTVSIPVEAPTAYADRVAIMLKTIQGFKCTVFIRPLYYKMTGGAVRYRQT